MKFLLKQKWSCKQWSLGYRLSEVKFATSLLGETSLTKWTSLSKITSLAHKGKFSCSPRDNKKCPAKAEHFLYSTKVEIILPCGASVTAWCYAQCLHSASHRGAICTRSLTSKLADSLRLIISLRTVRTWRKLFGEEFLVRMTESDSVNRCSREMGQKSVLSSISQK